MDADYIATIVLALVDHGNKQTDRKTKPSAWHTEPAVWPSVWYAEPPVYFYRTTEVEEERTIDDERVDLTYRDLIRMFSKLKKVQCHQM